MGFSLADLSRRWRSRPPAACARWVLAALALVLVVYLVAAKKPWTVTVAEGRAWKVSHYVAVYFWIAALINLGLVGFLAATASWWARAMEAVSPAPRPSPSRLFWPLVAGAMLLTAVLGWPRLGQSLWHDEAHRVQTTIAGEYKPGKDGALVYRAATWQDAFFYYKIPNHIPQSVLSKAANGVWLALVRPQGLQFSETAIRFPGYFAAIGAVAALAVWVRRMGYPAAGVLAAYLLSLHPWFIRYATEARGYAFVLLFVPLLFYAFLRVAEDGRPRWWVAFGALEFLLMYTYPTSVFLLGVANVCLMVALWRRWGATAEGLTQGLRWAVANLCAGMLFLQLMLPCIPQFLKYVKETPGQGELGYRWLQNTLSFLVAGVPWSYSFRENSSYLELFPWALQNPEGAVAIFLGVIALVALGLRRMATARRITALLTPVMVLPVIFCYLETRWRGGYLFEWYIIFFLPSLVALVALGWDDVFGFRTFRGARFCVLVSAVVLLVAYAVWTAPQRAFLLRQSVQPGRESVLLTRPSLDPRDPRQDQILTATFFSRPFPYDPRMILFHGAEEFAALIRRADAENKALYLNLGYLVTVEGEHPQKYRFLKTSGFFEDLGIRPGFMQTLGRHVFRYKPGSAAGYDFSQLPVDRGDRTSEDL